MTNLRRGREREDSGDGAMDFYQRIHRQARTYVKYCGREALFVDISIFLQVEPLT